MKPNRRAKLFTIAILTALLSIVPSFLLAVLLFIAKAEKMYFILMIFSIPLSGIFFYKKFIKTAVIISLLFPLSSPLIFILLEIKFFVAKRWYEFSCIFIGYILFCIMGFYYFLKFVDSVKWVT